MCIVDLQNMSCPRVTFFRLNPPNYLPDQTGKFSKKSDPTRSKYQQIINQYNRIITMS